MSTYVLTYVSPIGELTLSSDGKSLTGLWIEGQKHFGGKVLDNMTIGSGNTSLPIFVDTIHWLDQYFKGEKPSISDLPLAPQGTEFQQRVWKLLYEIPYGEITTYGELAEQLHSSARAVGTAVGHNPISIIIPCHRVIGANGQLKGYAGGIERKIWLLEHEKRGRSPFL